MKYIRKNRCCFKALCLEISQFTIIDSTSLYRIPGARIRDLASRAWGLLSYIPLKVTINRQVIVTKAQQTPGAGEPMVEVSGPRKIFYFSLTVFFLVCYIVSRNLFPFFPHVTFPYTSQLKKCSFFSFFLLT